MTARLPSGTRLAHLSFNANLIASARVVDLVLPGMRQAGDGLVVFVSSYSTSRRSTNSPASTSNKQCSAHSPTSTAYAEQVNSPPATDAQQLGTTSTLRRGTASTAHATRPAANAFTKRCCAASAWTSTAPRWRPAFAQARGRTRWFVSGYSWRSEIEEGLRFGEEGPQCSGSSWCRTGWRSLRWSLWRSYTWRCWLGWSIGQRSCGKKV